MKASTSGRARLTRLIEERTLVRSEGYTTVALVRAVAHLCGVKDVMRIDAVSSDASNAAYRPEAGGHRSGGGRHTSAAGGHPTEATADATTAATAELVGEIGDSEHYLFVIVDGLGMNRRPDFPAGGFFASHLARELRSVFPSTTSAALTTVHSLLWPAQHAVVGWFTHLPDHRRTVLPLRAIERFGKRPIAEHDIPFSDVVDAPSRFPDYPRRVRTYTFRKFTTGPYGAWSSGATEVEGYRNLRNAVRRVRRGLSRPDAPSYSYLYLSEVDHLSHLHGPNSPEVKREIRAVDRALARIRSTLPASVRLVVTADHGHIEIPQERLDVLEHTDPLLSLLSCPPSGEGRVPIFHVRPGCERTFRDAFAERFSDDFVLITPDDAEELGLLGPVPLAARTRARLGTCLAISSGPDAVEYLAPKDEPVGLVGMHGGMSRDEVEIPLFLA